MDVSNENLQVLVQYLNNTLSPDTDMRRKTEKDLQNIENNAGYPKLLLTLIGTVDVQLHIRQAGSITLKNFIKRNWRVIEGEPDKVSASDRQFVRTQIVDLMLLSPDIIQKQLSEAVSLIGREDFPGNWPELLPQLIKRMQSANDFRIINGVLLTAHSLFKRYRYEMKSNQLWTEIKYVLDTFAVAFTELFKTTVSLAEQHINDSEAIKVIYGSLISIAKIFYSLNFQDLPEHFEDNMGDWMMRFLQLLKTDVSSLKTESDEEPGLLEQLRSQICENVSMYAQKYEEDFQPYLPQFVQSTWELLLQTGMEMKYDLLVCNAIQFLTNVCERPTYKSLFEESNVLSQICEKIVVPNMEFRKSDEELFEDNPEEYIRKDIEGSDADTRRRAACDLVRALCKQFEAPVIQIFSAYVQQMLSLYAANPALNWAKKDAAVYLVTSLVSKGSTAKFGVTQTSALVNLEEFFRAQIASDLTAADVNAFPVLKADALKYLATFRSQLPPAVLIESIPACVNLMSAESIVVHSYAAHCLERLFTVRTTTKEAQQSQLVISAAHLQPVMQNLFSNLFGALGRRGSEENDYLMKCLMRSISVLQQAVIPLMGLTVERLTEKLVMVAKNPTKPNFNHYLFETLCALIRAAAKADHSTVAHFEAALFPPFQQILTQEVTEFMPYTFQILSLMLEMHGKKGQAGVIPEPYMALFPFLLVPALWERSGNITGLVKLLQAYLFVGAKEIVVGGSLFPMLGIFQKLIASKANDHEGFNLLNSMVQHLPNECWSTDKLISKIFSLLFQRLQSSKTAKFVKHFIVFLGLYATLKGAEALITVCEEIQTGIFGMLIEKIIIADCQKVSGTLERKIVAVGLTKILTDCPTIMLDGKYSYWSVMLQALIGLFELPEDEFVPEDEHYLDVEETPGYSASFCQLANATSTELDPTSVADARLFLVKSLEKLSQAHPQKLPAQFSNMNPQALQFLQSYFSATGVIIS